MSSSSQNNWQNGSREKQEDPRLPCETWGSWKVGDASSHWHRSTCFWSTVPGPSIREVPSEPGGESFGGQNRGVLRTQELN